MHVGFRNIVGSSCRKANAHRPLCNGRNQHPLRCHQCRAGSKELHTQSALLVPRHVSTEVPPSHLPAETVRRRLLHPQVRTMRANSQALRRRRLLRAQVPAGGSSTNLHFRVRQQLLGIEIRAMIAHTERTLCSGMAHSSIKIERLVRSFRITIPRLSRFDLHDSSRPEIKRFILQVQLPIAIETRFAGNVIAE